MVALDGSIGGQEIGFRWTPSTGLSSTSILNPVATVSAPVTYTLTAAAEDPSAPNLVVNPAFELGNVGFTSGYTYTANPITPGTYFLTTSPSLVNSNFPPCDDHTFGNGTGNLMLVNGTGSANSSVWCQTIPVMANSWYVMSGWVSTSPLSPPALQFSVNNVLLGTPYTPSFNLCDWQEFTASWFSGSATSATLCVKDVSGSGNGLFGDDYVLDDISMKKACTVSDMVNVSVVTVNAVLPPSIILNCSALATGIVLNGSASTSGPGITYSWDGPGIISGGNTAMATVNEPGIYTLIVSFDTGDGICAAVDMINVLPDPNTVIANASTNEDLSCFVTAASLSGSGSTLGGQVTYSWQPLSGIISGSNTLSPVVNQPGEYILLVTHSGGCTATASTNVYQDITPAAAVAAANGTLPCVAGTLTLSGNGSSTGSSYSYQWSGPGIVSGASTLNNCIVNTAGLYRITVTNDISGCTATASVSVTQSGTPPVVAVAANAPGILNCNTPIVSINSNGSSTGPNFTYQWGTINGSFTSPLNGATATVDTIGLYVLTITNTQNGCTASAPVNITGQFAPPLIAFTQPIPLISCTNDSVQINAGGSSVGPNFHYQWSTANGVLLSGDTTLMPWVGAVGTYRITITNSANGCTATAAATVSPNTTPPVAVASANAPGALNCITPNLLLNSTGSSNDSTITFLWTTINGHFTGTTNGPTATIDSAGLFVLSVTNTVNGCISRDTVDISALYNNPILAISPLMAVLDCTTDSLQINALQSSSGAGFQFSWTTSNGILLSGDTTLTPWVSAAGNYSLTISNSANGCTSAGTVVVLEDRIPPVANIIPPAVLDCITQQITIDASGSSGSASLLANWNYYPAPGAIGTGFVAGQTSLTPQVNAPGNYIFTLTNFQNHCQSIDSVAVLQSAVPPVAEAGPSPVVPCSALSADLDGSGSSQGAGFTYQWTGGATILQPQITLPGTYSLTVTNTANQCVSVDSVAVFPFGGIPSVDIAAPALITCVQPQVQLTGNASVAGVPSLSYQWTFSGSGNGIIAGDTTLIPTAASAGIYTLTVLNTQTGCTGTDAVMVTQSANIPVADAGPAQTLLCGVLQVTLDGTLSSSGSGLVYNWSTSTGNIVQGVTTLVPDVNGPGTYTLIVTDTLNGCTSTDNVLVQQDANAPLANAGAQVVITCVSPNASLNGTGSSTGAMISYLWTTSNGIIISGANTTTPVVGAAGIYTLEVKNNTNNCQSTSTVTVVDVTQPPLAVASAPQNLTCTQNTIPISGSGSSTGNNFTYIWSGPGIVNGSTTLSPTVNAAGNYILIVTDQTNGCTATSTATVTVNTTAPLAIVSTPQNLTCLQNPISLNGSNSSNGANFTYIWSGPGIVNGGTTLSPTVNAAGNYVLIVTNQTNGCTATASTTIAANLTAPTVMATVPQAITCLQNQISIDGSGSSSGPDFTNIWSGSGIINGATTLNPIVNMGGNYTLVITDQTNGCTSSATVVVLANTTPPLAVANTLQSITCIQPQTTLSGAGSSAGAGIIYNWSGPGIVGGSTTLSPLVNAGGTYTLVVTNPINGCTTTAQTTVNQNITVPNINAGPNFTISCKMPTVTFQGNSNTPGVQFLWTTTDGQLIAGQSTPFAVTDTAGTYTLIVTDPSTGCTASSSITVSENIAVFPAATSILPDCTHPTGRISFSGGGLGPFLYSIDGGANFVQNGTFSGLQPAIYQTVVQDADGCEQTTTFDLPAIILPVISLETSATIAAGDSIQLNALVNIPESAIASIIWSGGAGLSCTDCLDPVAKLGMEMAYQLVIKTIEGCADTAYIALFVKADGGNIFVPNTFSPAGESDNKLFRVFTDAQISLFKMGIFDRWGSSLFVSEDITQGWDGTAKGKLLNPGIYIYFIEVEIVKANGEKEKRLLKGDVLLAR